jgi:hypothetical protein
VRDASIQEMIPILERGHWTNVNHALALAPLVARIARDDLIKRLGDREPME